MEERRNDVELRVIAERLANLVKNHDNSETLAAEWRNRFCKKLDVAIEKLDSLPCGASKEERKGLRSDISWLQKIGSWALAIIITSLFTLGVGWGNISTTVMANSSKWRVLEPEHHELVKDVEVLKEKSYGYRGVEVVTKNPV